jgi:hypothetical protein
MSVLCCQEATLTALFDHLIDAGEQVRRCGAAILASQGWPRKALQAGSIGFDIHQHRAEARDPFRTVYARCRPGFRHEVRKIERF